MRSHQQTDSLRSKPGNVHTPNVVRTIFPKPPNIAQSLAILWHNWKLTVTPAISNDGHRIAKTRRITPKSGLTPYGRLEAGR
jgi:hypothetical protein